MKKRPLITVHLITISVLFILLATSCKKDEDDTTVTDIDGNVYNTVTIGSQVWMAENLKTTRYKDGTAIPNVTDNTAWRNSTTSAYCWYDNDINNKELYGALYNWYAVNTEKLCPKGWHVPSESDWNELIVFLGGEAVAGGKLKTIGTLEDGDGLWYEPNVDATNESGFSAYPGGLRSNAFYDINYGGVWWASTENSTNQPYYIFINNYDGTVGDSYDASITSGNSVRCLRD